MEADVANATPHKSGSKLQIYLVIAPRAVLIWTFILWHGGAQRRHFPSFPSPTEYTCNRIRKSIPIKMKIILLLRDKVKSYTYIIPIP